MIHQPTNQPGSSTARLDGGAELSTDNRRAVVRIGTRWFLDCLANVRAFGGGDILDGLIMLSITDANTRHLNSEDDRYNGARDVPPDDVRRPVSVYVVARELGMSYETTRRHVQRLIKAGLVERHETGVLIPERVFNAPETLLLTSRTYTTTRKLIEAMRAIGVL
ncbi:MAG: hypothetical protein KF842_01380 [Caulobacter sp.]|nr:hypothetical protein [Caulobacter sp.]